MRAVSLLCFCRWSVVVVCVRHFAYGLGSAGLGGAFGAGGGAAAARKVENKGGVISWRVCCLCVLCCG